MLIETFPNIYRLKPVQYIVHTYCKVVNMGSRHWSQWKIVPIESSVLLRLSGPLFLCSTCWQPLLPDFATYIMQNINAVRGPSQFVNVPFLASQPSCKIQCPNKGPKKNNVTKCILVQTCLPNSYSIFNASFCRESLISLFLVPQTF